MGSKKRDAGAEKPERWGPYERDTLMVCRREEKKNFARAFADSLNFQTDRDRVFISQFARRSLSTDGIVEFRGRQLFLQLLIIRV